MSSFGPDFLGIGVQKGGTTTLHALLDAHPDVALPAGKEVHYFSLHYRFGQAWYQDHFSHRTPGQICGEITPYYIFHPLAPERIHACCPQVRLLVLLRDPVERALSQLFHSQRLGFEPLQPHDAFRAEADRLEAANLAVASGERHLSHQEHSYVARSRYEVQLARYEALFAKEQILILRSEDLFGHGQRTWMQVQAFLGLKEIPLPPLPRANAGRGEAALVSTELRHQLREQLQSTYVAMEKSYGICWDSRAKD